MTLECSTCRKPAVVVKNGQSRCANHRDDFAIFGELTEISEEKIQQMIDQFMPILQKIMPSFQRAMVQFDHMRRHPGTELMDVDADPADLPSDFDPDELLPRQDGGP